MLGRLPVRDRPDLPGRRGCVPLGLTGGIGNVILGVVDLRATSAGLQALGLDVLDGGRHERFGTRNRIVPLGESYLELLAVEDRAVAEQHEFGRSLLRRIEGGDRLTRWSIRTTQIVEVAAELDLEVDDRSRAHPDGRTLRWRSAGMSPSLADPSRPFWMQWPDADWPGHEPASSQAQIVELELVVPDQSELDRWTLGADLPLLVHEGPADLHSVTIEVEGSGRLVIGN